MLGNFSFGDYFKKEAIYFAWDLLVNELKLDPTRLWFTVFGGDDEVPPDEEAERYWQQVGARPERILRFGRKDNFWQMAETGPCGPNTEIHYYIGEHPTDPQFNRTELVNGPGDDTIEIWNLVFMQYNRIEVAPGRYELRPLPAPSVDTGAGLERLSAILQGVKSNYDTDLILPIINYIAELAGKEYVYDSATGMSMRVLADHARATAFSLADGIAPGNVGRNYVLRKIMRRAIYHGAKEIGLNSPFFHRVTDFVVDFMGDAFPELIASRQLIEETVRGEEQRFSRILTVGEPRLAELFDRYSPAIPPMIELARTYDTYGVPRDLIRVELFQHGVDLAEDDFNQQFDSALRELQQQSAPQLAGAATARRAREVYNLIAQQQLPRTQFTGYQETETQDCKVLAIVLGDDLRDELGAGETGEVILDRTPFYSEAGGQIGDSGVLGGENVLATVEDTYSVIQGYHLHRTKVERGSLRVGDLLNAKVDSDRRRRIKANHTGTHLLHAALREVLGAHVKQAGSLVAPDRLRFDFTHYAPLTAEEIAEIERLVNREVLQNRLVETELKPLEEALSSGAMALFGEKYASEVRVVSVPGFSTELCGGTHVHATGDIGPFKIISDSSIAAGVRRIEALTADAAIGRLQTDEQVIGRLVEKLRAKPDEIPAQVDKLQEQVRKYEREIEQLKMKLALGQSEAAGEHINQIEGISVLTRRVSDLDANGMRQLADALSQRLRSGVVVLGQAANGKASRVVRVTDDLTNRLDAGKIVRAVSALVGGKGGGRADMATGGGTDTAKLDQALAESAEIVRSVISGSDS
jgi:alanyl-tRNA synthetase